jgi:hypothetical protein
VQHAEPDGAAARLRAQPAPVVCRIRHGQLLFDPRTVLPAQDALLLRGLCTVLAG